MHAQKHAALPLHGESFHGKGTPNDVWDAWLAPYVGHRFSDPAVVADRAHPERLKPQAPVVLADLSDEQLSAKLGGLGLPRGGSRAAKIQRLHDTLTADSAIF